MPTYLISPVEETTWEEDPDAFAAALTARWAGAHVTGDPPDSPTVLSFALEEQNEHVLGRLHRDGQALSLDADVPAAAEIALWWRARVPDDLELLFYDEGYSAGVLMESGTDGHTLASAYLAAANA